MSLRYHRQTLLPQVGEQGQQKLSHARVLLIGCGALGTVIADQLVRAGIGHLRICDRDIVEESNLQRQVLFDQSDADAALPKAIAAAQRLRRINPQVTVEPLVTDVHSGNVESLLPATLILDGTDNVETRYLINDLAVKHGVPWVYGACVGTSGRVMPVFPGAGPCLRCIFPDPPAAGELETCDTAGVLGAAAAVIASLQVAAAMRILLGQLSPQSLSLTSADVWTGRFHSVDLAAARRDDCPACAQRRFEFLDRPSGPAAALCGRGAVQVRPPRQTRLDLPALAQRLEKLGKLTPSDHFVRCTLHDSSLTLTVFPDARALVHGTTDLALARSIYARYVGA